jgi:hypothetical protein
LNQAHNEKQDTPHNTSEAEDSKPRKEDDEDRRRKRVSVLETFAGFDLDDGSDAGSFKTKPDSPIVLRKTRGKLFKAKKSPEIPVVKKLPRQLETSQAAIQTAIQLGRASTFSDDGSVCTVKPKKSEELKKQGPFKTVVKKIASKCSISNLRLASSKVQTKAEQKALLARNNEFHQSPSLELITKELVGEARNKCLKWQEGAADAVALTPSPSLALNLDLITNSAKLGTIAENDDEAEDRSVHQAYAQVEAADENTGGQHAHYQTYGQHSANIEPTVSTRSPHQASVEDSSEDDSSSYYAPSTIRNSNSDATIARPSFQRSSRIPDFGAALEDHRLSVLSTRTDYDLINEAMNLSRPSRASILAFLESNGEDMRESGAGSDEDSYSLSRFSRFMASNLSA